MQKRLAVALSCLAVFVVACAPTTVTPVATQELISPLPFAEAFRLVTTAINSQPYPSDTGGWVITSSDQVGGFISTELNGRTYQFMAGNVPYRAFVSVALVDRGNGTTAINISQNRHAEAEKMADSIAASLGL